MVKPDKGQQNVTVESIKLIVEAGGLKKDDNPPKSGASEFNTIPRNMDEFSKMLR